MSKVFMLVTDDEYELPLAIADSADELARIVKTTPNSIRSAISHAKKKCQRSIYISVECEEEV